MQNELEKQVNFLAFENIYESNELSERATTEEFSVVQIEGNLVDSMVYIHSAGNISTENLSKTSL